MRLQPGSLDPAHFVERHGLLLIVAFGESVIAIGTGVGQLPLMPGLFGGRSSRRRSRPPCGGRTSCATRRAPRRCSMRAGAESPASGDERVHAAARRNLSPSPGRDTTAVCAPCARASAVWPAARPGP
ncbi:low temperature requirement protein A [Streptomyces sp. NBC_01530]|uniref:low temperature requirement protein A n=1 Tax=Streptomyces sp. NBC_01530 TaxID=2903895 RepID=UPI0038680D8C